MVSIDLRLHLQGDDRSARAIAGAMSRLIADGDLAPGARLPTVRQVAADLGVSPATVSEAWQAMRRTGLISSRGRAGSFVREAEREPLSAPLLSPRMLGLEGELGAMQLDLSRGVPDAELLPALGPALSRVAQHAAVGYYQQDPVIEPLREVLAQPPFESLTVVDGATDAVDRILALTIRFGDHVVVESPGFGPFLDLLDSYGARVVPVGVDARGMLPQDLERALGSQPRLVISQPRAQNPSGCSMDSARIAELADVLQGHRDGHRVVVVEDDHSGMICQAAPVTLASRLPDQVVHVRGFSKSHGPDLRIAAVYGPARLIDAVVARRMLGPGWTPHLVQSVLHDLLTDPVASGRVATARIEYASRQRRLRTALAAHGIDVPDYDGLNAWVPVPDERQALIRLAAAGIRVAGGSPFLAPGWTGGDHVRLSLGALHGDVDRVAAALATA